MGENVCGIIAASKQVDKKFLQFRGKLEKLQNLSLTANQKKCWDGGPINNWKLYGKNTKC
jgi:hypothetical protein